MSGRLVGEVVEWLLTPAAQELNLSTAERAVLLVIAERADERTREMWRHRGDGMSLLDRICTAVKLKEDGASNLFKKMAKKGLEVRIPRTDEDGNEVRAKDGRLIFAHHGKSMKFRLPALPTSVDMPGSPVLEPPFPVDNPADQPVDNPPGDDRSPFPEPPFEAEGHSQNRASGSKGVPRTAPSTSKDNPSKEDPSTPMDPSSPPELEDTRPAPATPPAGTTSHHMGFDAEYQDAMITLTRFPDFGDQYIERAKAELGANADRQALIVRAAQFAEEGIPA